MSSRFALSPLQISAERMVGESFALITWHMAGPSSKNDRKNKQYM